MTILTDKQLFDALNYARSVDESEGKRIIQGFQKDQPALSQTLFNVFPSLIAEKNQEMAMMFMDLIFDTLCVYQFSFGDAPVQTEAWLKQQMLQMTTELQALKLSDKKKAGMMGDIPQAKLMEIMRDAIADYAAETGVSTSAVKVTQASMVSVIKLLDNLYSPSTIH